jgi:predicted RNase H-like nuclease
MPARLDGLGSSSTTEPSPKPPSVVGFVSSSTRLSRQAWALAPKILDVDRSRDQLGSSLFEVHPEVSFRALAMTPLTAGKRIWAGSVERRRLLEGAGIVIPGDIGPAGRGAGVDDVLDAAVAAWTARRLADGTARCLPDPPERDAQGRNTAIWY